MQMNEKDIQATFQRAHEREEDAIANAKEGFKQRVEGLPVPTPPASTSNGRASTAELKSRLNWGEPGLTIVDVRDRSTFNECRIMGAINLPLSTLLETAPSRLQSPTRDIYVYGGTDEETSAAAATLRDAGFYKVAELSGGLQNWTDIGGPIEGVATNQEPNASAYNVVSRLKEFSQERKVEQRLN